MRIDGRTELASPRDAVWRAIQDPLSFQSCIPGCRRLEQIAPDRFAASVVLTVAGIKGSYEGEFDISDRQPGTGYVLHAKGQGAPGSAEGRIRITLDDGPEGTTLSYDGDIDIGGRIARVGQRVLGGVIKAMIGQFLGCLASKV